LIDLSLTGISFVEFILELLDLSFALGHFLLGQTLFFGQLGDLTIQFGLFGYQLSDDLLIVLYLFLQGS
jgi:hypothetical protein